VRALKVGSDDHAHYGAMTFEKQIERGEGHGFAFLDNRVELYTAIERFLAKHMTAAAAASSGSN